MSFTGRELSAGNGTSAMRAGEDWRERTERRKRVRMPLHWTLVLTFEGMAHPVRSRVTNLSIDGFYCVLHQPLTPGECVNCDLVVPTHNLHGPPEVLLLRCVAQVLRVEKIEDDGYGLACRIEDYHLISSSSNGKQQETLACTI